MIKLAQRIEIDESPTVKINDLAKTKTNLINFSAGDPKVPLHPAIKKALSQEKSLGYPPVAGIPELRELACNWMNERYHSSLQMNETVVTPGGKFALYALLNVVLNPGDEVLIGCPYWVSYHPIVQLFSAKVQVVMGGVDWKITPELLEKKANERTKVLILNNATNPTGVLYSHDEIKALLMWAQKRGCLVISDEVYSELVYDKQKFVSCAEFKEHKEHVATIESCSKNFALAGLRVGFAFAPKPLINAMIKLLSQSATGTSVISQWAAVAALENAREITTGVRDIMEKRRNLFVATYQDLFSTSLEKTQSGIYQFVPVMQKSEDYCIAALEKGVALVPGSAFGVDGYVRFAFCEDENNLVNGLRRLR